MLPNFTFALCLMRQLIFGTSAALLKLKRIVTECNITFKLQGY